MKDRFFYKKLISLTLPMAFQELMLAMVAVADALMLGNVEQDMMSAVSLATQIQFVQNMILYTITSALAVLGAQYLGKGDKKSLNDIFCLTLRLSGALSIVCFLLCFFIPETLMQIFTDQPVLIALGADYLKIASFSYLLTGITQCYLRVMKLSGHATMAAAVSGTAVLLNIMGNAVLILGLFGVTPLGVEGAAISTLIARIVEFSWAFLLSTFGKKYIRPSLKGMFRRNREDDTIYISVSGGDCGAAIGRHGETLEAITYMTNLIANK
ncbi:MAG: KH domain-containing protein, partial [Clostridia bacterium]|nr:KH domain-containing protein [Clostridia bacterium]